MERVFLHGFASDRHIWSGLVKDMPDTQTPDIRFSADSSPKLPELEKNSVLIGWSMGGMIACDMLAAQPDMVKKMVFIASSPGYVSSSFFPEGKPESAVITLRNKIKNNDMHGVGDFQKQLFTIPEIRNGHLRRFRKYVAGTLSITVYQLLRSLEYLRTWRPTPPYPDIPVLIIHGTGDSVVNPAAAERWKELFPRTQIEYSDAGHAPVLTCEQTVRSLIDSFAAP